VTFHPVIRPRSHVREKAAVDVMESAVLTSSFSLKLI
jgi:hypothetical protein